MDNDLLTLWLDAPFMGETEVRQIVADLQAARDEIKQLEADDEKAEKAALDEITWERDEAQQERDEALSGQAAAERDLKALRDEARAAAVRLQDALGEHPAPAPANVTPFPKRGRK